MNNSVLQIMNDDEKRCEGAAKRRLQTLRSDPGQRRQTKNNIPQIMNDDKKRCEGAAKRRPQTLRSDDKHLTAVPYK